jgi:Flp pilus assembly pilin Flp
MTFSPAGAFTASLGRVNRARFHRARRPKVMTIHLLRNEHGQTMAEYSVVLAVVTLLVIGSLTMLSTGLTGHITRIAGYIFQ